MFLLDTNICIYLIKRRSQALLDRVTAHSPGDVALSSVTLAELELGVEKSAALARNREALELFLAPFEILPFDVEAARAYGKLRTELERRGRPIGSLDLMIAAHALSVGAIVVTNNVREFARVPRLDVENWTRVKAP
jgi:tRNA(fMet)-specific endonuclease VapC